MLGIIGAMKEEVNALVALMSVEKETEVLNYRFYQGKLGLAETVVVQGGIGKVNATISTTLLLDHFDIDHQKQVLHVWIEFLHAVLQE